MGITKKKMSILKTQKCDCIYFLKAFFLINFLQNAVNIKVTSFPQVKKNPPNNILAINMVFFCFLSYKITVSLSQINNYVVSDLKQALEGGTRVR